MCSGLTPGATRRRYGTTGRPAGLGSAYYHNFYLYDTIGDSTPLLSHVLTYVRAAGLTRKSGRVWVRAPLVLFNLLSVTLTWLSRLMRRGPGVGIARYDVLNGRRPRPGRDRT